MTAGTAARALLVALSLGGPWARAGPDARADQEFQVRTEITEVEFGRAFPLWVTRSWPADAPPGPFDVHLLDPLVLERPRRRLDQDQGQVRETLQFQARAFLLEDFQLEGTSFTLRVLPSLDHAAPGPVEPPGPLLEVPGGVPLPIQLLGALLFVMAILLGLRVLRRPAPSATGSDLVSPWTLARQQLAALRAQGGHLTAQGRFPGDGLSGAIRQLLADGLGVPAWERTTPEIVAHAELQARCPVGPQQLLHDLLIRCDRLRFSAPPGLTEDWEEALEGFDAFLETAAPPERPADTVRGAGEDPA